MSNEPGIIGKQIYHMDEIPSTNAEMLLHSKEYEHGSVLVATRQTAGRGRSGRNWHSGEGGLYMSMLFKEIGRPSDYLPFVLLSALAVARTLKLHTKENIAIKWPNDVYASGNKICGILAESSVRGRFAHLVVGIGINITNSVTGLEHLRHPAVALKDITYNSPDPDQFLKELLVELNTLYVDFCRGAFPDHLPELDKLLYSRGKPQKLNMNGVVREMTPLNFHSDASLVCLENDEIKKVYLGEF
jgi:BirA family transcriptional regulator, biotin operon repressor / biotin---[acetyl-CoA-carboxylase] ligase